MTYNMRQTSDGELVALMTLDHQYLGFEPYEWTANDKNIALTNGKDLNLFQYQADGVYIGHFFYVSRGRQAIQVANEALWAMFIKPHVQVIIGMTPVGQRGARWLSRHLGFKSYGLIDTVPGECELFIMSRKEYEEA